jgi:hypothetical protein
MNLRRGVLTLVACLLMLIAPGPSSPLEAGPSPSPAQPARIVAIGDVHGAFDQFVEILQKSGLIDASQRWSGGAAVLVQTGDIFDRGPDVRKALDLLMRLEDEAERAGGRVEVLNGNHEMMNLLSDFRDVSPATYAAFVDNRSEERRRRAYDDFARIVRRRGQKGATPQPREEWMAAHPPGFLEYVESLAPRGKYGRWLRSHKVVVTLDGTGFMHAGIHPASEGSLEDLNRTAARDVAAWDRARDMMVRAQLVPSFCTLTEAVEAAAAELMRISEALKESSAPGDHVTQELVEALQGLLQIGKSSLLDPEGPLWFRGFAQWPDEDEPRVTALLTRLGVQRFVTGHTPSLPGRIRARFGGRIFLIDTGMLVSYFKTGRPSALELQGGRITALYSDGTREVLVPGSAASFRPGGFAPPDPPSRPWRASSRDCSSPQEYEILVASCITG